ncbi:MAG: DUF5318 family protein [Ilumatobacteraceae bacterium]
MSLSVDALRGTGSGRGQIDHRLARQHLINEYRRGRLGQEQVCDAHPELIRAAKNVGTPSAASCPICEAEELKLVTYVFGPRLPAQGKCVTTAKELHALDRRREELSAYIVEACVACHWHHLRSVLPVGGR